MSADELIRCPLCTGAGTREHFPGASGPARTWPLLRCEGCGLVFQRTRPPAVALEEAQRTAYGAPQRRFCSAIEPLIRRFRGARVRLARRLLPPGGSVIDVGCGRGLFLRLLHERGYTVQGTELSPITAANAYPGVPIRSGDFLPGQLPPASQDLVSIWHVLEHLRYPAQTLAAAREVLRPGAALLIAVPNLASFQARLGGELWFHLDLPRHIFHFSPATLRALLERAGFELETLRTGQWEMDPFGFLQTALNRLGLRPGALYDTLRNHPEVRADLSRSYRLAMLAAFPPGMALALAASLAARLLGRAGTIIAIARKPQERKAPGRAPQPPGCIEKR